MFISLINFFIFDCVPDSIANDFTTTHTHTHTHNVHDNQEEE